MAPLATHTAQPVEDISAVLGRFNAWAGKPAKPGAAKPGTGAREISYEEAVQSSRYRRADRSALPPLAKKTGAEVKDKAAAASTIKPQGALKIAPAPPPQEKTIKTTAAGKPANVPGKTVREKKSAVARKAAEAQPAFRQVLEKSVAVEPATVPPIPARPIAVQPASVASNAVATQSRSAETGRAVMLSVRISASEQALIRTRAQEASLSISAYMRQCALEVEQLRDQVERTLAAMQRAVPQQPAPQAPLLAPQTRPGFFVRIAQRLLGTGNRSSLAVRA